jgi:hypothetical protein
MLFAGIDDQNIVVQIIDVPDSVSTDPLSYIVHDLGLTGVWVNAMIDGEGRARYCGIGYIYIREMDRFVPPKPFDSWVLDGSFVWHPPVAHPGDGLYTWSEAEQRWMSVEIGI